MKIILLNLIIKLWVRQEVWVVSKKLKMKKVSLNLVQIQKAIKNQFLDQKVR